jgi:hypothetical protein
LRNISQKIVTKVVKKQVGVVHVIPFAPTTHSSITRLNLIDSNVILDLGDVFDEAFVEMGNHFCNRMSISSLE